jgi:hypothetical protein
LVRKKKSFFRIIFFSCIALPHARGQRNNARFGLLTWATIRLDTDGYQQIDSMIRILDIRKTSTVTHLKLNVDDNQSLYKPPSLEKYQSLLNETILRITTSRKTVTTTTVTTTTTTTTTTIKTTTVTTAVTTTTITMLKKNVTVVKTP